MKIEVEHESDDSLARELWQFSLINHPASRLQLNLYARQSRPSRRHKWRLASLRRSGWNRMDNRDYTGYGMDPADVPLPGWVKREALQILASQTTVEGATNDVT